MARLAPERLQICATIGANIAFRVGPNSNKPWMMLVQGLSGVKEDWRDMASTLAKDFRLILVDNRGIGESSIPDGPYTMHELAEDAVAVARRVGVNRDNKMHLLGISMGGMIAQTVALQVPEILASVTLGCTMHGGPNVIPAEKGFLKAMTTPRGENQSKRDFLKHVNSFNYTPKFLTTQAEKFESLVDAMLPQRRSVRGVAGQLGAIAKFNVERDISNIKVPTLIIHGDEDAVVPFPNGERIHRKIHGSQFVRLSGCGHCFWDMDDGVAAQAIRDFALSHQKMPSKL